MSMHNNIIYCVCDQYTKGNNIGQQKPFERKNKDRQSGSAHKPIYTGLKDLGKEDSCAREDWYWTG